jgi:hypothetical protein
VNHASACAEDRRDLSTLSVPAYHWNVDLLSSFTFLMSGHGVPVCASMMLGDPEYAREQLRLACTFDDGALQQLAVEMLSAVAHLNPARQAAAAWAH